MRLSLWYTNFLFSIKPITWTENEWGVVLACFNVGVMILATLVFGLVI